MPDSAGASEGSTGSAARHLIRRGMMMEYWGYLSILRWVGRRPKVPPGAEAFSYHQPVLPLLIVFIVLSAIELVVVDLLVRRWAGVRIALLILGVWGLVWMFGLLCGFLTRPHAIGPDGVLLRSGPELEVPLDWEQIASVTRHRRITQDKQPQVSTDQDGMRTLHLHMQHETNIRIALREPVTVPLARGPENVREIHLFADRPGDLLDAVIRHHVPAS